MDILQTDQLLTVGAFLAVLIAALYWVQGNRAALKGRITKGRRMSVAEVTALGPDARAMLLSIDGRDYLVVATKKQAPVITALPVAPASLSPAPHLTTDPTASLAVSSAAILAASPVSDPNTIPATSPAPHMPRAAATGSQVTA